ncbi:MAG: SDR family oxidoreductase [bacterium]
MKSFDGKIVYITGGSSGIGLAAAKRLVASGSHLLLFARGEERLVSSTEGLRARRRHDGQRVSWMQLDVSRKDQVDRVMARAVAGFGAPDLLINCAGRAYPRRFEEISYEQFEETMRTNFFSVWHTSSCLVPHMKKKGGCIANVASMLGFVGIFGYTDYTASKFAIMGFSEALRSELKPCGIRVCVLCPPDTDTPAFQVENQTKPEETKAISAAAKILQPDEVARALLRGIRAGRFMILPSFEGKLTYLAKRLAPSLVNRVMDRAIRKVQRSRR